MPHGTGVWVNDDLRQHALCLLDARILRPGDTKKRVAIDPQLSPMKPSRKSGLASPAISSDFHLCGRIIFVWFDVSMPKSETSRSPITVSNVEYPTFEAMK